MTSAVEDSLKEVEQRGMAEAAAAAEAAEASLKEVADAERRIFWDDSPEELRMAEVW